MNNKEFKNVSVDELMHFGFDEAIKYLKRGNKVCREGWNGKKQYIQLATNISYKTVDGEIVNCEHDAIGNQAIAFVGTSGVQMGWLASQADMLAEDWMFAEEGAEAKPVTEATVFIEGEYYVLPFYVVYR